MAKPESIEGICDQYLTKLKSGEILPPETFLDGIGDTADIADRDLLLSKLSEIAGGSLRTWRQPESVTLPGPGSVDAGVQNGFETSLSNLPQNDAVQLALGHTIGDYVLTKLIGRGGMGQVYLAQQSSTGREVALKLVGRAAAELETRQRFKQEVMTAARVEHPNVIRVFDVQLDHEPAFFTMQYVNGEGLDERIQTSPMEPVEAARVISLCADGIQAAHDLTIVHRDIKPANILLDRDQQPIITDFGVAKLMEEDVTQTVHGTVMGTPAYMSPEQAKPSGTTDHLSDVYSLGATLYHMLTGRPPFQAASYYETVQQILFARLIPPIDLNSSIPVDLEAICLKALAFEPSARYSSAADLRDDLENFLDSRPVHARPRSRLDEVRKFVRRNKGLAASLSLIFLLLTGGVIGTSYGLVKSWKSEAALKKADAERQEYFEDAQAVIDEFYVGLLDSPEFRKTPGLSKVQADLAQQVLKYYGKFEREHPDDLDVLAKAAMAFERYATALEKTAERKDAFEARANAIELYERLAGLMPADFHLSSGCDASDIRLRLAALYAGEARQRMGAGELEVADEGFRKSFDLFDQLVVGDLDGDRYRETKRRHALALGQYSKFASIFIPTDPGVAIKARRQSIAIYEQLLEQQDDIHVRCLHAGALGFLCETLASVGQKDDLPAIGEELKDAVDAVFQADPEDIALREQAMNAQALYARLLVDIDHDTADNEVMNTIEMLKDEIQKNPNNSTFKYRLMTVATEAGERAHRRQDWGQLEVLLGQYSRVMGMLPQEDLHIQVRIEVCRQSLLKAMLMLQREQFEEAVVEWGECRRLITELTKVFSSDARLKLRIGLTWLWQARLAHELGRSGQVNQFIANGMAALEPLVPRVVKHPSAQVTAEPGLFHTLLDLPADPDAASQQKRLVIWINKWAEFNPHWKPSHHGAAD